MRETPLEEKPSRHLEELLVNLTDMLPALACISNFLHYRESEIYHFPKCQFEITRSSWDECMVLRSQCGAQASHVAGGISLPCCHSKTVLRVFPEDRIGVSTVDIRVFNIHLQFGDQGSFTTW
jgi:hypothetical protein